MELIGNTIQLLFTLSLCYGLYYFVIERPNQKDKNASDWEKKENTANRGCLPILIVGFAIIFLIMVFQQCTFGHITVFE